MNGAAMLLTPDNVIMAALAVAAAADIASRRIPNALTLAIGLMGLAASVGVGQLASGAAAAVVCLGATVPAWRRGLVGGGDVKLAAAAAAWVRLDHLLEFALLVALCGGLLSLLVLLHSPAGERRLVRANATASLAVGRVSIARSSEMSIPYGVAIAIGAVIARSSILP